MTVTFPVSDFRRLITLGGFYPGDTRPKPVLGGPRPEPGISGQSIERIRLEPTLLAVSRAFEPGRHHLMRGHWLSWMACIVGMRKVHRDGTGEFVFHDPEGMFPMSDILCAQYYNYSIKTVQKYIRESRQAVLDEYYEVFFFGEGQDSERES